MGVRNLYYSYAAYCNPDTLKNWSCQYYCDVPGSPTSQFQTLSVHYDKSTDTLNFLGWNDATKEVVIAYRGTQSIRNFLDDFDMFQTKTDFANISGARVHAGFDAAYKKLRNATMIDFQNLMAMKPGYDIRITGHSLGGAMATLFALELSYVYHYKVHLHTFGTPRVGNAVVSKAVAQFVDVHWRVVNNADPIPHFPPQLLFPDYFHAPREVWLHPGNKSQICNGSGEDPTCSDSLSTLKYNRSDHAHYLGVVSEWC